MRTFAQKPKVTQQTTFATSTTPSRVHHGPAIVDEILRSPGHPLDLATRNFMEPRFGHDFSRVRVHSDARAAQSARALGALAFTIGQHIVFDAKRYSPGNEVGRFLLAHELAHVVQQGGSNDVLPTTFNVQTADTPWEREADLIATRVVRNNPAVPDATKSGRDIPARVAWQKSSSVAPWRSSLMRLPHGSIQRQVCCETNHATSANHVLIELWYKYRFPEHRLLREYAIPGAAEYGRTGYADLVSSVTHEIWDIIGSGDLPESFTTSQGQPMRGRSEDVAHYVNTARVGCPVVPPWSLGESLLTQEDIPPGRPVLTVRPRGPGILQYSRRSSEEARVLEGITWTREQLRRRGEQIPVPAISPAIANPQTAGTEFIPQGQETRPPTLSQTAPVPVLTHLEPELSAFRQVVEQALQSSNLPTSDNYLLLAPPDFYEQYVRAPRRAAAEETVRRAYEVQGASARVNPVMAAHRIGIGILGLHAALTLAGITAAVGASAIVFSASAAAVLPSLSTAGEVAARMVRAIVAAMRNPQLAATTAGVVMYVASFSEAQAQNIANQPPQLESLRLVRFVPEGAVRITYRSQSERQAGVHAFYEGEPYLVVGRAQRPSAHQ